MAWWGWSIAVGVTAIALDRVLLALEQRGLVYWRRRKAASGSASSAMLGIQALVEPAAEHVVEERVRAASEVERAADDEPFEPT